MLKMGICLESYYDQRIKVPFHIGIMDRIRFTLESRRMRGALKEILLLDIFRYDDAT